MKATRLVSAWIEAVRGYYIVKETVGVHNAKLLVITWPDKYSTPEGAQAAIDRVFKKSEELV